MKKLAVIYHAKCVDGLAAAAAVLCQWDHADVEFIPATYGKLHELPEISGYEEVYVLDFSLDLPTYAKLAMVNRKVMTVDHHKGALETLQKSAEHKNVDFIYDVEHSGAALAWKLFGPDEMKSPILVQHIEDRDIWTWRLDNTAEYLQWLFLQGIEDPYQMWQLIRMFQHSEYTRQSALAQGAALVRQLKLSVQDSCRKAFATNIVGFDCICAASTINQSEMGNYLLGVHEFAKVAVIFEMDGLDTIKCSLRSRDDSALKMAKHFGGGGHERAAGCNMSVFHFIKD